MSMNPTPTGSENPRKEGRGLALRMIALLIPVTVIPSLLMGLTIYNRARTLMVQQISERMETFLKESTNQLDSWLLDKTLALETLPRNPEFIQDVNEFLQLSPSNANYSDARNQTLGYIRALNPTGQQSLFNHFIMVLPSGEIALSTNRTWEKSFISDETYFSEKINNGLKNDFLGVRPPLLYHQQNSPEFEVTLFSSVPLFDGEQNLIGYLVGISDARSIQSVLEANAAFLPTNSLFIYTEDQQFIGITDVTKSLSLKPITPGSEQVDLIFSGETDSHLARTYESYDGTSVLGLYHFYNTLNSGVLVEVEASDILGTINTLAPTAAIAITVISLVIAGLIYWVSQRITTPLKELASITEEFAHGNWESRSNYDRGDEIGTLANAFNRMADDLSTLYTQMESQVEERTRQVLATSEVSTMATSASGMNELLDRTTDLISDRFEYFHIAIYILDQDREEAELRAGTGEEARNLLRQGYSFQVQRESIYQQVIRSNEPIVVSDSDIAGNEINFDMLPEAKSKIAIPISIGTDVFGIIDVQSKLPEAFPLATSSVLMTLANQLAGAIYNFQLREGTQVDLAQINQMYLTSQRLALADTLDEIFNEVAVGVQQTSFFAAVYRPVGEYFELVQPQDQKPYYADQLPTTLNVPNRLASTYFTLLTPVIIKDLSNAMAPLRPELLNPPRALDAREAGFIPIMIDRELKALIILGSRETNKISLDTVQPFRSLADLVQTKLSKIELQEQNAIKLQNLQVVKEFTEEILQQSDANKLYLLIHNKIKEILGNLDFYIALYDHKTERIEIPYLYEGEDPISINPFPLGEGLSSIVIRTRQPLMLIENAEERARQLGAKVVGKAAKSWLGLPLMIGEDVIGLMSVQDTEHENRFSQADLDFLQELAKSIAGAIHSTHQLAEVQRRAFQLETSAEIAREASTTLDQQELLSYTLQLVQDRFNFYHASIFLLDPAKEFAVVVESTGEAGAKMKEDGHKLAVGSQSIIGQVTVEKEPLVVNDVTADPTHKFNPLLPDTRAELGIPILLGDTVLGAMDVQSTVPYDFTPDDIEVLQIFANQLAVSINNANLFAETQEHLAQHRLIHHVTTVAASASTIEEAISSAVQGLRVTLGDNVSVLMLDEKNNMLRMIASAGYDQVVDGMQIRVGEGITGWVAEHKEPVMINNVQDDPRYISGRKEVRSEIAVPLSYRGEFLGVLNVESETQNAYDDHDQDILATLAGSLAAIIINARLSERQQTLFDITNKIRQSVNMGTILETTAVELTRVLQARKARIQVGGGHVQMPESSNGNPDEHSSGIEKEGQA